MIINYLISELIFTAALYTYPYLDLLIFSLTFTNNKFGINFHWSITLQTSIKHQ